MQARSHTTRGGGISAVDLQAAISELDQEKVGSSALAGSDGAAGVGYMPSGVGAVAITIESKLRESVSVKDFGAIGDGATDDTAAIQAAIDYCISAGKSLHIPAGGYLTGPITLNGSNYVPPINAQYQALSSMTGDGRFQSIFIAKPGLYSSNQYVLTGNNASGVTWCDFGVDGDGITSNGIDFSWIGGSGGNPSLAPSNQNVFQNLFVQGCSVTSFNLTQCHDSKITGLWSRGVTDGQPAIIFEGGGGQLAMSDTWIGSGFISISCQSAGFTNCGFFGGVELGGAGYNQIVFNNCHLYPNNIAGRIVTSTAIGNATRGVTWNGCFFNISPYIVGGRYWQGMEFNACFFQAPTNGFFDSGLFSAAAGSGYPPVFSFKVCSFEGATPSTNAGAWKVRHVDCRNSSGQTFSDFGDMSTSGSISTVGSITSTAERSTFNAVIVDSVTSSSVPTGLGVTMNVSVGTFLLSVMSFGTAGANVRTNSLYHVGTFQGDGFAATLISSSNGSGGGRSFTVTQPTAGTIVVTNTSGSDCNMTAALIGVGG